jgi:hypothetical protein
MAAVREQEVSKMSAEVRNGKADQNSRVLICIRCEWDLKSVNRVASEVSKAITEDKGWPGVFAFNVSKLVACVQKKIEAYTNRSAEHAEEG